MKHYCSHLLSYGLIILMVIGLGCSTKEEFIPELSVSVDNADTTTPHALTFDNKGGSVSLQIKANTEWKISNPSNWISLSHTEGSGQQSVKATISPTQESRSTVILITLKEFKQESVAIDIVQHYTPEEPKDDNSGDNEDGNEGDREDPSNPNQGGDQSGDGDSNENPNENPSDKDDPTDPEPGNDPNNPDNEGDGDGNGDKDGEGEGNENGNGNGDENGDGGEGIDPDNPNENPEDQEPEDDTDDPQPINIAELRSLMTEEMKSVAIDNQHDRVLTAIVMNDTNAGNFYPNHLFLSAEGATSADNGITLSGKITSPATLGVEMGDKVEITLKSKNAVAIKYKGRYEITGEVGTEWMELKVISSDNKIEPIEIDAQELGQYQAMTVRIKDVQPTSSGRWHSTDNKGYTEFTSSNGYAFGVYTRAEALFSANEYHVTQGDISGIVVIEDNEALLYPRNLEDVYDFNGASPEPDPEEPDEPEDPEDPENPDDPENPQEPESPEDPNDKEGSNGDNNNPDPNPDQGSEDNTDQGGDTPSGGGNDNPEDSGNEEGDDPKEDDPSQITETYTLVESVEKLTEGKYYIGGYQGSTLYLATGSLTEHNHCTTKSFSYEDDKITPLEDVDAAIVNLIRSEDDKGYHIQFTDGRYLTATDNKAGSLALSSQKSNYWIFSEHNEGGFILKQSGGINVKLIISKRAKGDILRSIDGEESGGGVIFIRIN
ncbi:MAG: hypothetical protein IKM69_00030 [Alistipes sp.]|nr:hypothetical protein [Alistipes sp.]